MPRRGDEFDAETARIEDYIAKRIDLDLAAVAAAGADLAQSQRPAEEALQLVAKGVDKRSDGRR